MMQVTSSTLESLKKLLKNNEGITSTQVHGLIIYEFPNINNKDLCILDISLRADMALYNRCISQKKLD